MAAKPYRPVVSLITDSGQQQVSATELQSKIRKLDNMVKKTMYRIEQREKEYQRILEGMSPAEKEKLKEGLKLFQLSEKGKNA